MLKIIASATMLLVAGMAFATSYSSNVPTTPPVMVVNGGQSVTSQNGSAATVSATTTTTPQWTDCAAEGGACTAFTGPTLVRYGAGNQFIIKEVTGPFSCGNGTFGDPAYGVVKSCSYVPVTSSIQWITCAGEGALCVVPGPTQVRYGANDKFVIKDAPGSVACSNSVFGDPAYGVVKSCSYRYTDASSSSAISGATTPIASNFNYADLIVPGAHNPVPSMAPDVVGAFRFICTAGQMSYDDPILYSGVKSGSPHLHQFYGNSQTNYNSNYASLRTSGDSTCSNPLNRSAYWAPALMNAAGQVIRPDYLSIYYKRLPDNDPMCLKQAAEGCFDIPTGLRVVYGFDMKRMNDAQPENKNFAFRCVSPGKPSIQRGTTAEAIADCGGAGQIATFIGFGSCWNGQLDSADHRSHLVAPQYIGHAYAECPADHPKLLPQLTQQIFYTIEQSDGDVYFSSDRMNGMNMPGGSTFHADYMEGWDPTIRDIWHRNCIGKMLNCSDGELGNGTMLKRPQLTYLASPRLATPPTR